MNMSLTALGSVNHEALFIIVGIGNLLIAAYVLSKNPHHIINSTFFIFAFGEAIMVGSIGLIYLTKSFFFNQFVFYGASLMVFGFILFSRVFPQRPMPSKSFCIMSALPALVITILSALNLIVTDMMILPDGSIEAVHGSAQMLVIAIGLGYLLFTIFFFVRNYMRCSGVYCSQFKYLILGALLLIAGTIFFGSILPALGYHSFNIFTPLFSIIFIGFIAYAIVRHQLMDIKVVIQRGLIYSALLGIIVGFYLSLMHLLGFIFQQATDVTILLSAGVTTVLGIFTAPIIERYFRRITDKIFFKDTYDYSSELQKLSKIMNNTLGLKDTLQDASKKLQQIFKVEKVVFILPHERVVCSNGEFEKYKPSYFNDVLAGVKNKKENTTILKFKKEFNIQALLPITTEDAFMGMLGMGKKLSGDAYTPQDMTLLKTFTYQIGNTLKKVELYEKVRKYAEELETKVEARTLELQHAHKTQEQMMLDISHGLQTPLTIAKNQLDQLKQELPNATNLQAFEKSLDEVSAFIYDLLNLAQLETTHTIQKDSINLSNLVGESVEYLTTVADTQNISIKSSIQEGIVLPAVKKKIEELIANLMSNAMKYMPERGKKKICVSLNHNNNVVILTIADTGIGISEDDLKHVFDRFYRANTPSKRVTRGTGLGLSICKKIADAHNATINVKSKLSVGSTFTVTFHKV